VAIRGYSIGGYWCLFYYWLLVAIILMDIGGYFINGYCGYSINGYCCYFINGYYGYFINGYWWLFY
jgi:hypothetical protein